MNEIETLSDRTVIRLSGDDRLSFLQGLITQDVDRLAKEKAIFAALLTPQGKILFDFFVVNHGDALLIDCFAETAPALLKRLSMYKLRAKVSLEIDAALKVTASGDEIEGGFVDPRADALGWRSIDLDASPSLGSGHDARRIAVGAPEFGKDFGSDEMFLTDVNYDLLNGVSYKKGCFIGQEVTSRMKRKGDIRRRTLIAEIGGTEPAKGASITAGASTLGEVLSGADGIALAAIRLDRLQKAESEQTPITCENHELHLRFPAYLEQG
ncbi:YgfZ/GcvT domain-containing protein [Hyphococcus sp.]|uniref:CAF17-like 4Fe-4S cluster assembly/insertion protein YgfZ n=1 Tax=Hyphococcus sp. TaxID=2038636 RepID=UPI00208BEFE3|nr:MAG: glycine cleavage system protein T [Marinicaulis sp.]